MGWQGPTTCLALILQSIAAERAARSIPGGKGFAPKKPEDIQTVVDPDPYNSTTAAAAAAARPRRGELDKHAGVLR